MQSEKWFSNFLHPSTAKGEATSQGTPGFVPKYKDFFGGFFLVCRFSCSIRMCLWATKDIEH